MRRSRSSACSGKSRWICPARRSSISCRAPACGRMACPLACVRAGAGLSSSSPMPARRKALRKVCDTKARCSASVRSKAAGS
ncbi:Uncharacterised protein [Bordetella pertussis]|nr:Uncharacterised protein [Bordetella pertussis]